MTNKEKYKQAFSGLQPSRDIRLEEKIMKEYKRKHTKRTMLWQPSFALRSLQVEAAPMHQPRWHSAYDSALDPRRSDDGGIECER